jgi:hypothetical protein
MHGSGTLAFPVVGVMACPAEAHLPKGRDDLS